MENNQRDLNDNTSKDQNLNSSPENSGKTPGNKDLNYTTSGGKGNTQSPSNHTPRKNNDNDTPATRVKSDSDSDEQELKNKQHPHKNLFPESEDDYAHDM